MNSEITLASLSSGDVDEANMEVVLPVEEVAKQLNFHTEFLEELPTEVNLSDLSEAELYHWDEYSSEEDASNWEEEEYLGNQQ